MFLNRHLVMSDSEFGRRPAENARANAASVEACRSELREVLEEWLILKLRDHDPIPTIEGMDLGIVESEAA